MNMNLGKLREMVRDREAWRPAGLGPQRVGHNLVTEQQQWKYRPPPSGRREEHQGFSISRQVRPLLASAVSKVCPKRHTNGVAGTA